MERPVQVPVLAVPALISERRPRSTAIAAADHASHGQCQLQPGVSGEVEFTPTRYSRGTGRRRAGRVLQSKFPQQQRFGSELHSHQ